MKASQRVNSKVGKVKTEGIFQGILPTEATTVRLKKKKMTVLSMVLLSHKQLRVKEISIHNCSYIFQKDAILKKVSELTCQITASVR